MAVLRDLPGVPSGGRGFLANPLIQSGQMVPKHRSGPYLRTEMKLALEDPRLAWVT